MDNEESAPPEHKEGDKTAAESGPRISYWVVAFLDLLGYRSVLEKLDVFPLVPEVLPNLEQAFKRAIQFRRRLLHEIENLLAEDEDSLPDLSHLPPTAQQLAVTWRKAKLIKSPGPDHIVLACSLMPEAEHFPLRAVYNLVIAASGAMLTQLSLGAANPEDTLPLRGGIDLAAGMFLQPEDFLYSPALTRAYDLEHEQALYGRTVAGGRFIQFLDYEANVNALDYESQVQRSLAHQIRRFFFTDRDGSFVLDFMSPDLAAITPPDLCRDAVRDAWLFVRAGHQKARVAGNYVVASKYAWLIDYMRPRLSAWGVDLSEMENKPQ
jgi:hypothetical protein